MSARRALAAAARRTRQTPPAVACLCDWSGHPRGGPACRARASCLPVAPVADDAPGGAASSAYRDRLAGTTGAVLRDWEPQLHRPDAADPAPF